MASASIARTLGTPTSQVKCTFSGWFKNSTSSFATHRGLFLASTGTFTTLALFLHDTANAMSIYADNASSQRFSQKTNALFRDVGAWMHVVMTIDSTEAQADRVQLAVNGVRVTSWDTDSQWTTIENLAALASGSTMTFGASNSSGGAVSQYWDGSISHVHFTDGYAYAASEFGEFDSTSGIWKIKPSPSVTYGNNGFFCKMEDRDNLDLDSSPNAHTMTTTGTVTATYDNPSNNFCTLNGLDNYYFGATFSDGATTVATGGGKSFGTSTMWLSSGLWYFEAKDIVSVTSDVIGITSTLSASGTQYGSQAGNYALYSYDGKIYTGGVSSSYGVTWGATDIIGCYIDLDANKLYFAKNGSIMNSGTGFDITAVASTENGGYTTVLADDHSSYSVTWSANFGNGYFGTTAVTSAVADEGGIGAFEYDPSDGGASSFDGSAKDFRAICTKNIKAYGG